MKTQQTRTSFGSNVGITVLVLVYIWLLMQIAIQSRIRHVLSVGRMGLLTGVLNVMSFYMALASDKQKKDRF